MHSQRNDLNRGYRFGQFVPGRSRPLMAMIEVTNRCNMACPICFADAGHTSTDDITIEKIGAYLKRLIEVTETPVPIQISGGEPTMRRDLPDIIALAKNLGYRHIELITNGIRISENPTMLLELKRCGLKAIYLQFDGLNRESSLKIRGRDMTGVGRRAVEAARRAGLCCTLAMAVTRGINHHEVGHVVRFAIENIDTVRAINFQSATRFTGRFDLDNKCGGYSLGELVKLIETQAGIPADTFLSEHMGHPLCNAMSYVFLVKGGLEPLFKYISREEMLGFLGEQRRETLLDLFEGKKSFFSRYLNHPKAWRLIAKAAPIFGYNPFNVLQSRHILVFAKSFMEQECFDSERIKRCCYGIVKEEGVFSFCAFNNLYRFPMRTEAGQKS